MVRPKIPTTGGSTSYERRQQGTEQHADPRGGGAAKADRRLGQGRRTGLRPERERPRLRGGDVGGAGPAAAPGPPEVRRGFFWLLHAAPQHPGLLPLPAGREPAAAAAADLPAGRPAVRAPAPAATAAVRAVPADEPAVGGILHGLCGRPARLRPGRRSAGAGAAADQGLRRTERR